MTIVCGTDFTEAAGRAVRVAAALAARSNVELSLVHVVDLAGAEKLAQPSGDAPLGPLGKYVEEEIERLRRALRDEALRLAPFGAKVTTELLSGTADEALAAYAERQSARLIVVSALGRRSPKLWRLGSTADRVAQIARVPVLVVRNGGALEAWLTGAQKLSMVVGVDASPTSDAAVRWAVDFARLGECRVVGAHVYWPPEARERLADTTKRAATGIPIGRGHPEVEAELQRELGPRLAALSSGTAIELVLVGGLGRPADHLVQIASAEKANLVVVGNHQRGGLSRVWHGSVSHGVLDVCGSSVVCVPVVAEG